MQTLHTTEDAPAPSSPAPSASGTAARIPALDGLRGLAVALVVVYHFTPEVLPAGFLGVDVFFVLSGFLITSLALAEHDRSGTLRVGAFFGRRARRLLPAAVTCVVAVCVTAVLLEPAAGRQGLRGEAMASLLYGANWWSIAQGTSYQARFGAESPLNHFWSLAVEEQFYLLFPLVIVGVALLVARRHGDRRRLAGWLLGLAGVAALASSWLMAVVHDPLSDPSRAYLGSDTRAQAVLAGVAAACGVHLWRHHLVAVHARRALLAVAGVGLLLVLWASRTASFRADWLYDGGFLLVALATVAVVVALATGRTALSRLFEVRALCVLGLYSYGIYLWHWPVRVFVDEDRTGLDGLALLGVRLALTAVLTVASARLVEDRFRRRHRAAPAAGAAKGARRWTPLAGVAAVAAAAVAVWVLAVPGPGPTGASSTATAPTVPPAPAPFSVPTTDPAAGPAAAPVPPGRLGPADGPVRVLWEGDSVAWTLGGGELVFPQPTRYDSPFPSDQVVIWNKASYGCPLLDVVSRSMGQARRMGDYCPNRTVSWTEAITAFGPDVVSWSAGLRDVTDVQIDGRWLPFGSPEWDASYLDGLDQLRALATGHGAALLLVGQPDPFPDPAEKTEEGLLPENIWRWGHLRELQRRFAAAHPADTRAVDLQALLCPTGSCPTAAPDGTTYLLDGIHWSRPGAVAVGPAVAAAMRQALAAPATATP